MIKEKAEVVADKLKEINEDVSYVNSMLDDVVKEYSGDLDVIMQKISIDVLQVDYPAINTIEKYFMELSNALYFVCERVEKLGIYDSLSKSKAQETYNKKYLDITTTVIGKKPTVGEAQAVSEQAAIYDKTVNDIYNKAYKILKSKVGAAETMVSTLSKVLSHRIQESQMTYTQTGRQILNEGNII